MSQIIPFNAAGNAVAPAYLKRFASAATINEEIQVGASFPVISIKGKAFAIVRDGERSFITKPDDPDEVAQSIGVVIVRANAKARTFYQKRFVDGDDDGKRPTCYSMDGVAPAPDAEQPQAKKCQLCPHSVFGTRERDDGTTSKGSACSQNVRMAVATPDNPKEVFLLRVPPASIKPFRELIKIAKQRDIPYNALVVRLGFDKEAAAPKLTFKPIGFVPEDLFATVNEMYDDDTVLDIVGRMGTAEHAPADEDETVADKAKPAASAPAAEDEEDEEAPPPPKAAKAKKAKPAPVVEDDEDEDEDEDEAPTPEPKPTRAKKAKPAAQPASTGGSLVDELNAMLGGLDD
ncbi:MAG: hypothetical protein WC972_02420 [Trueperaceae bacterium]